MPCPRQAPGEWQQKKLFLSNKRRKYAEIADTPQVVGVDSKQGDRPQMAPISQMPKRYAVISKRRVPSKAGPFGSLRLPLFSILTTTIMRAVYHAAPRKMKPTVGLTSFFRLMNLCEKKRVSTNVHASFLLFQKFRILRRVKKLFFLQSRLAYPAMEYPWVPM